MLEASDFEMPLEKQLRIRVIDKEIDECNDIEALRENLKQCACSLMKYQHLVLEMFGLMTLKLDSLLL